MFLGGFLCLTWDGYSDKLAPCRAPCEWQYLGSIYGVMDREDRREDIFTNMRVARNMDDTRP